MDLGAYINKDDEFVAKMVGKIPRPRGVRFMFREEKDERQPDMFNKYCGQDVIYIHTRCGVCSPNSPDDPDCNYNACGGKEFEERNKDIFLESEDDDFDGTYRDHYFKIPDSLMEEYTKIKKDLIEKERGASNA